MKAAGISVSKNLAVIVGVDWYIPLTGNPALPRIMHRDLFGPEYTRQQRREKEDSFRIYTPANGSAFPGCPYFSRWAGQRELYLHEGEIERIDFARVVEDFCKVYGCEIVGYSPDQAQVISKRVQAFPVPKDWPHNRTLLDVLNSAANRYDGYLFAEQTPMQYMWGNLPRDEHGNACFPTDKIPATGRWDGIRALLNALAPCYAAHLENLKAARLDEESIARADREVEAFWESIPTDSRIWIRLLVPPPHDSRRLVTMREAMPLLKGRKAIYDGSAEY